MTEDPDQARQTDTPEGPEKDPQSAEVGVGRTDGRQNALVHEGASPDEDSNDHADERVKVTQPDGKPVPEAGD